MNIVVSGATGYIGFKLIKKLLSKGYNILALLRNESEKLTILKAQYDDSLCISNLNDKSVEEIIKDFNPDDIVSTTCCYDSSIDALNKSVRANYELPSELLQATLLCNKKIKFINLGTSLPKNVNTYSFIKNQFSELGNYFSLTHNINFINVQLESFYGSDEPRNRFILRSVLNLLNGNELNVTEGLQKRDYIASEDVIDALCFLIEKAEISENYVDIPLGTGVAPSIREILEFLKEVTEVDTKINFGAVAARKNEPDTCADITVLDKLGYEKKYIYWKDGLKALVREIKNEVIN